MGRNRGGTGSAPRRPGCDWIPDKRVRRSRRGISGRAQHAGFVRPGGADPPGAGGPGECATWHILLRGRHGYVMAHIGEPAISPVTR